MTLRGSAWAASVLLVAAAAAVAQDKPAEPAARQLVVKAKIRGFERSQPTDTPPLVIATVEAPPFFLPSNTSIDAAGALVATIKGTKPDVPGFVEVFCPGGSKRGFVVAEVESMCGELDLGEIGFGNDAPVLVAGSVVGAGNVPAAGANVRIHMNCGGRGPNSLASMRGRADADGSFVVRGEIRGKSVTELSVSSEGRWISREPTPFKRGALDVKIVATATSGVHGTVELPTGYSWDDLVVQLRCPPGAARNVRVVDVDGYSAGGSNDAVEFPARGDFRLEGLEPGAYELRVKFRGASRPLVVVRDVKVEAATAELPTLVVTEPPRRASVRVLAADGSPAKGALLRARNQGDRGSFRAVKLDADAAADVVYVGDGVELAARADGTDYVRTTTSAPEVELKPPASVPTIVTATLPAGAPTKSETSNLCIAFEWRAPADTPAAAVEAVADENDPRTAEKVESPFADAGPTSATLVVPGWYRVTLRSRHATGWSARSLEPVLAKGGAASLTVSMSVEEIEEMLKWTPPPFPKPR